MKPSLCSDKYDWCSLLDIRLVKEMNCSRPLTTCTWGWQKLAGRFVIEINNAEIKKIANAKEKIVLMCIVVSKVNRDRSFLTGAWALIRYYMVVNKWGTWEWDKMKSRFEGLSNHHSSLYGTERRKYNIQFLIFN